MTEHQELLAQFAKIVSEVGRIPESRVTGEARLVDDLDLDSLSLIEIAEIVRETWHVSLGQDDMRQFLTVDDVLSAIERQLT